LKNINISDQIFFLSILYLTFRDTLLKRLYQIQDFNWLENKKLTMLVGRMRSVIIDDNDALITPQLKYYIVEDNDRFNERAISLQSLRLIGYPHYISRTNKCIYYFKSGNDIDNEDKIKMALYTFLSNFNYPTINFSSYIFNINTFEIIKVNTNKK
jgi:hypothetical protein